MASVYLESTIISYLAAKPSRDLIAAANQQITNEWWSSHRQHFDLYISQVVITECRAGDSIAARQRLNIIDGLPVLDVDLKAEALAETLIRGIPLPPKAEIDALHIANAVLLHRIGEICRSNDYFPPTICTPQQLMEA